MKKDAIGAGRKNVKKMLDTDSEFGTDRQDFEDDFDDMSEKDQSRFSEQDSEVSKFSMGQFNQFNKANEQIYKGLRFRDTISELYDDDDKDKVFKSSMKKGGALHKYNKKNMFG